MTKAEIVTKIAKKTGLDKESVLLIVEEMMSTIKESIIKDEPVFLRGFGSFIAKTRAEKTARNISADKALIVPAHKIPFFKPSDAFKEALAPNLQNEDK